MGLLRRKGRTGSPDDSWSETEDLPLNRDGDPVSRNQARKHEKQAAREKHKKEAAERREADARRKEDMEKKAKEEETEEQRSKYGVLPINNYAWKDDKPKNELEQDIRKLKADQVGQMVTFRARLHNIRKLSAHLMFIELRQQTATIQGILHEHGSVSPHFLYWAEHLHVETIVRVKGVIQEPKAKEGEVKGVSIHNIEIHIHEMHVEGAPSEPLPFTVHEAEVSKAEAEAEGDTRHRVSDRARQNNRIVDLRTTTSQAIFRVQSAICHAFRTNLTELGFIEIHTPKLWGAASESGASVFKVDYFGRPAFLAQSPQLGKQMAIAADLRKVFEIGPVFRAENSNTHRHLTEFTGLDLEMAIDEHYHEVLRTLDSTFKAIFKHIYTNYKPEIEDVKRQFPHEDLVWLDETPVIPFAEAIRMLNDSGHLSEDGKQLPENEDLGTRDEIALGRVIKEKLGTDYYVLDKFPVSARPFYTMPDPYDPTVTNAFDIFLRGQEILSGGQRIHDAPTLIEKMEKMKMDPKTMEEYMSGFEWGAPPHGGGGIGMERILMLLLQLGDIRNATLFARDPRSLPYTPPVKQLRHPEASTLHPPWAGQDRAAAHMDLQPLEKLIANYGDASNTSWLEPKFEIYREPHTGAAVGFVPHQGFAITIGDPLCHESQYAKVIASYIRFIKKEQHLKPLWLLCGHAAQEILGVKFDWRTFSVAAEQRLDPGNNPAIHDPDLQRKCRHAEKEGVKLHDIPIGTPIPDDVKKQVDQRVQDWLHGRKGKQVHLTDVHPWQDTPHRQYHYSTTADGTIAGLVILAQLSPDHGWQIKFSLDFPGAPSGAIELLVLHALKACAASGATTVTFGGGAMNTFKVGHNMRGTRVKVLSKAYHMIANELHLTNKSEFREKLGAKEDPIYSMSTPSLQVRAIS
jgi:ergosteryl-3beta-O-L-aspartate synthase